MYALMGNEAQFERKIKNATRETIDLIYQNPKQALINLFDKNDKPILLSYTTTDEYTDEYELTFDITKNDVKIKYIDFDEYDKVEPMWVDLNNYL